MTLLQAEIALARQQPAQALALLDGIGTPIAKTHRARLLELRARAAQADGNLFLAATARAELEASLPRRERSENTRNIQALLEHTPLQTFQYRDPGSLATIGRNQTPQQSKGLAAGIKQAAALDLGLMPVAEFVLMKSVLNPAHAARALIARGLPLPRPYTGDLSASDSERAQADVDGYRPFNRVALLLPQDGALASAAQAVRDGFIVGYYEESRARPEVRVYTTGNSRESVLHAYDQARRDGAQAVVGPLGREAVAAISKLIAKAACRCSPSIAVAPHRPRQAA